MCHGETRDLCLSEEDRLDPDPREAGKESGLKLVLLGNTEARDLRRVVSLYEAYGWAEAVKLGNGGQGHSQVEGRWDKNAAGKSEMCFRLARFHYDMTVRVLVVSSEPLQRLGIVAALTGFPGIQIAGSLSSLDLPEARVKVHEASVMVLGGRLTANEAAWQVASLCKNRRRPKVILVSNSSSPRWISRGPVEIRIVSGDIIPEQLAAQVHQTADPPDADVGEQTAGSAYRQADGRLLTPRQQQILSLVSEGAANKEIARQLGISQHTVKNHLHQIFRRLDVASRTRALRVFSGRGLRP